MSTHHPKPQPGKATPGARVAIVAARFNDHIVNKLIASAQLRLDELAVIDVALHRVPGAFELPVAAKWIAEHGKADAIICIGCLIRGDTPHFDFVADQAARGIAAVSLETSVPVIFGVLTVNTEQQALDRAGGAHSDAGRNAADAAIEMITLRQKVGS